MIIGCVTEGRGAQNLTFALKLVGFVCGKAESSAPGRFCSSQSVCCSTQLMTSDTVEPYFVFIWKEYINRELSCCSVEVFSLILPSVAAGHHVETLLIWVFNYDNSSAVLLAA